VTADAGPGRFIYRVSGPAGGPHTRNCNAPAIRIRGRWPTHPNCTNLSTRTPWRRKPPRPGRGHDGPSALPRLDRGPPTAWGIGQTETAALPRPPQRSLPGGPKGPWRGCAAARGFPSRLSAGPSEVPKPGPASNHLARVSSWCGRDKAIAVQLQRRTTDPGSWTAACAPRVRNGPWSGVPVPNRWDRTATPRARVERLLDAGCSAGKSTSPPPHVVHPSALRPALERAGHQLAPPGPVAPLPDPTFCTRSVLAGCAVGEITAGPPSMPARVPWSCRPERPRNRPAGPDFCPCPLRRPKTLLTPPPSCGSSPKTVVKQLALQVPRPGGLLFFPPRPTRRPDAPFAPCGPGPRPAEWLPAAGRCSPR